MARPAVTEKTIEGVKEELTCVICQELFKMPKTLHCLHTFCEDCLQKAEVARKRMRVSRDPGSPSANEVECPSCRGKFDYEGHIAGITTNFVYVNLIEHLVIHEKISTEGNLTCGKCTDEARAIAFCYDCKCAVCEPCKQMHQRSVKHSSHNICSLEEIKQSAILPTLAKNYLCLKHNAEQSLFCFDCQEIICRDCTIVQSDHRDHKFQFISQVIEDQKKQMREKFKPLEENLKIVTGCCERLAAHIDKVTQVHDKRARRINDAVDQSIEMLEQRRAHLLEESHSVHAVKKKNLDIELEQVEGARASIASAIDFCTTTLEKRSEVEILMYKKEMLARAKTLSEMHKAFENFDISEDDHTHFAYDDQPMRSFGKLCDAPFPNTSTAEGPGLEVPLQNVDTSFKIVACDSNGRGLMSGGGDYNIEVACVPTITQKTVKYPSIVTDNQDGTYMVRYRPEYPGHTKVSVKFNNEHIQGSPFNPRVARNYIHPIPAPFTLTVPNSSPWGVAMVSDTELAVTASDCVVHIYDIITREEVDQVRSNFTRPYGMSTDHENCLWITDREAHMVQKFRRDSDGEFVKLFQFGSRGIQAGQFSHPRGVAVNPATGYIYISDMKNNRIQIFKPDSPDSPAPRYVGQFGAPGNGRGLFNLPAGMIFNLKGELVVCDDHNCRLQVFDPDGTYKYMLGTTSSEKGLLCSPIDITQDFRGRLVITEFGSHSVTFLSPEGDILNCIRTIGTGFGQFVHPRGITSDSAGFVYVADNENMRVVRF